MKTVDAFLNDKWSIGDLCHRRNCLTITFDESEIVFVSCLYSDSNYGDNRTYHRTICLRGYGLIEILSDNEEDLFIERFDKDEKNY